MALEYAAERACSSIRVRFVDRRLLARLYSIYFNHVTRIRELMEFDLCSFYDYV
jgi:hypothetical protein